MWRKLGLQVLCPSLLRRVMVIRDVQWFQWLSTFMALMTILLSVISIWLGEHAIDRSKNSDWAERKKGCCIYQLTMTCGWSSLILVTQKCSSQIAWWSFCGWKLSFQDLKVISGGCNSSTSVMINGSHSALLCKMTANRSLWRMVVKN